MENETNKDVRNDNSVVVNSVAEFIDYISQVNCDVKRNYGRNNILLFRGQSDCRNVLLPSIGRHCDELIDENFLKEERNMVELAKFKLPELFNSNMQPIDLLALLQHHGIPTRLLDISENALVSLFFACNNKKDREKDGEVLVFKHDEHDIEDLPMVNAIADSYRFARGNAVPLEKFYSNVVKQSYFTEQSYLHDNGEMTVAQGADWVCDCCNEIMIIYAKSYGLRQRIQRGRYILFPNSIITDEKGNRFFVQNIDPISKEHGAIINRYIIPKESKKRILEDLRILGISRDMLFLDNDDIICREIANRIRN